MAFLSEKVPDPFNFSGLKIERKAGEVTYNFGQRGKKTLTFDEIGKNSRAQG